MFSKMSGQNKNIPKYRDSQYIVLINSYQASMDKAILIRVTCCLINYHSPRKQVRLHSHPLLSDEFFCILNLQRPIFLTFTINTRFRTSTFHAYIKAVQLCHVACRTTRFGKSCEPH